MSKRIITTSEQAEAFLDIWKYLSANGKLFIPVHDFEGTSEIFAEQDTDGNKTIRTFVDSQAIDLYIKILMSKNQDPNFGEIKVGITPVKILQKKLTEVYGKDQQDGKVVECLLTTYDEFGNIREVDTIWTQASN